MLTQEPSTKTEDVNDEADSRREPTLRPLVAIYVVALCSALFQVIAFARSTHADIGELLVGSLIYSFPNIPLIIVATLSVMKRRKAWALWISSSLLVATPICVLWLLLAIFPDQSGPSGPVPSMLPDSKAAVVILHMASAAFVFFVATIVDMMDSNRAQQ